MFASQQLLPPMNNPSLSIMSTRTYRERESETSALLHTSTMGKVWFPFLFARVFCDVDLLTVLSDVCTSPDLFLQVLWQIDCWK